MKTAVDEVISTGRSAVHLPRVDTKKQTVHESIGVFTSHPSCLRLTSASPDRNARCTQEFYFQTGKKNLKDMFFNKLWCSGPYNTEGLLSGLILVMITDVKAI